MCGYCGRLRAVSLFVNRSALFVEAVSKSTFAFSYVLFVTVVTLYHVDNVFGVAVNVMINKSSFAGRIRCPSQFEISQLLLKQVPRLARLILGTALQNFCYLDTSHCFMSVSWNSGYGKTSLVI